MKGARLYWDVVRGWTIDTPCALSAPQVRRIANWSLNAQRQRLAAKVGDAREQALRAIAELESGKIRQRLISTDLYKE